MDTAAATVETTTTTVATVTDALGQNFQWEEIVYNAESLASKLASLSLNNGGGGSGGSAGGGILSSTTPSNVLISIPIMYGAGLLTSFSPCVWGLLPLTMSYISTAAGERNDQRTTIPTIVFALGLASVFCTLGITVSLFGGIFGGTTSTTNTSTGIILSLLANTICFGMGLQLLDIVQIPFQRLFASMESSLLSLFSSSSSTSSGTSSSSSVTGRNNNKEEELLFIDASTGQFVLSKEDLNNDNNKDKNSPNGSLLRTFLLGGSSALVASPCATPVLTSILAYVASAQNVILGCILLLVYTLGYSTPLLVTAATGGQALVNLRQKGEGNTTNDLYGIIGPWITPLTGGILLWYGTNGLLTAVFGDPSLSAIAPIL